MEYLFDSSDSYDTTLKLEEKEFHAHKFILIARSAVFRAMFQNDLSESQTGIITIVDSDPDSFKEFLLYLYTGKFENITYSSAFHLYITADKYDVQELKMFCLKHLLQSLSVENVCDIVVLADDYNEDELFCTAQDFFNQNLIEIFATDTWNSLLRSKPSLVQKLLTTMATKVKVIKAASVTQEECTSPAMK